MDNELFHSLEWSFGNCDVYNRKIFESDEWENYNNEFNRIAGGYKYRWGDCEIIGLFAYIYLNPEIINFDLRSKKLYEPQLPNTKPVLGKQEELIQNIKNKIKTIIILLTRLFKKALKD